MILVLVFHILNSVPFLFEINILTSIVIPFTLLCDRMGKICNGDSWRKEYLKSVKRLDSALNWMILCLFKDWSHLCLLFEWEKAT